MNCKRQRGLSLVSVLFLGAIGAFVLLTAFRAIPVITEYMAIERIVGVLAEEGDQGTSAAELRRGFDRRSQIDDVSSVSGVDLQIFKEGNQTVIEVDYARTVPLVANVSLLIEFQVSSRAR